MPGDNIYSPIIENPDGSIYPENFERNGGTPVNLIPGVGIGITGTYPNKTITNLYSPQNTSIPSASSLGIVSGGSTDQSTGINTALSTHAGIYFDFQPSGGIYVSGTITATGKILQFANGTYLNFTSTGVLNGGIIQANYNNTIFVSPYDSNGYTTTLIKPEIPYYGKYSLKWNGAKGDGYTNDQPALQQAIDICVYNGLPDMWLPSSNYYISKGIMLRKDVNGQNAGLSIGTSVQANGFTIAGQGGIDGASFVTILRTNNPATFLFGYQKAKGFRMHNIQMTGVNTASQSATPYQIWQDPTFTFLNNSSADNANAPHCGIAGDMFGNAAVSNKYPDFTGYYTEASQGGSTDVVIDNVYTENFTVGIVDSPSGFIQNGEILVINNWWATNNKSAFASGNSQTRTILINSPHIWGGNKYIFNFRDYGNAIGCPCIVTGMNVAGANRYLCNLNAFISDGLVIDKSQMESLYSLGGCFTGKNGILKITNSWVNLAGSETSSQVGGGTAVSQPYTIFNGDQLIVDKGELFQYGANTYMPLTVNINTGSFSNVTFDNIPIALQRGTTMTFKECKAQSIFGDNLIIGNLQPSEMGTAAQLFTSGMKIEYYRGNTRTKLANNVLGGYMISKNVVAVPLSAPITIGTVDAANLAATFTLSNTSNDFKMLLIGDNLLYTATDEFGNSSICAFGQVTALNSSTGVVSIKGIAKGVTTSTYTVSIYRNEFLLPQLIVGDTTSTSNQMANAVLEGGGSNIPTGIPVYMPHFPLGTTITSYNSGTGVITLSLAATITDTNVALTSADWIGQEFGVANPSDTHLLGNKRGDVIYNTDNVGNPTVSYWLCNQSGITNTAKSPAYSTYN